ncbi:MAG: PEP-CTERM sorting domain-containing protein [Bryobacteraceae bacterium]
MKKMIGVALLALAAPMFAGSIAFDDFSLPQGPLTASSSDGPVDIGGGIFRTLTLTTLGNVPPVQYTTQVAAGLLDITNGTGDDSQVIITYDLPLLAIPMGATNVQFFFTIVQSDGNPTQVAFGGVLGSGGTVNIPGNTLNQVIGFAITPPVGPGQGTITFDGTPGWDLAADSLGIRWTDPQTGVPEPGSFVLLGLGLAAAGIISRRR